MTRPHEFPLDIVRDHMVARVRGAGALIDTGSPLTFRASASISEQVGRPLRWLVGTDFLRRHRVQLDWRRHRLVVGGPELAGETLPLTPHAGLYQVPLDGAHGTALAYLDTGAHLSYAPAEAVAGLTPSGQATDFYPLFGEFEVPTYELAVRVGARRIIGRFGVLPELLGLLLSGIGSSGWILGSDFFRDRVIQLDLGRNRLVDATNASPRPRTTGTSQRKATSEDGVVDEATSACFRVTDTGIGIPRDRVEAVFEPFVQVRSDYARSSGCSGLGLAISRDLACGKGGDLRARSTEGEGSSFTVTLRRAG